MQPSDDQDHFLIPAQLIRQFSRALGHWEKMESEWLIAIFAARLLALRLHKFFDFFDYIHINSKIQFSHSPQSFKLYSIIFENLDDFVFTSCPNFAIIEKMSSLQNHDAGSGS